MNFLQYISQESVFWVNLPYVLYSVCLWKTLQINTRISFTEIPGPFSPPVVYRLWLFLFWPFPLKPIFNYNLWFRYSANFNKSVPARIYDWNALNGHVAGFREFVANSFHLKIVNILFFIFFSKTNQIGMVHDRSSTHNLYLKYGCKSPSSGWLRIFSAAATSRNVLKLYWIMKSEINPLLITYSICICWQIL